MHIDSFKDTVKSCRFCFMCRHLSGTANVTFRESDTPRVRAAMLDAVLRDPGKLSDPDLIETLYRCDLSGACTFHCVGKYDENGLVLAARRDVVEKGLAPEKVRKLADEFEATSEWTLEGNSPLGKEDVLYFEDRSTQETPSIRTALETLAQKGGVSLRTIRGGCIGKVLDVLGFSERAEAAGRKFAEFIRGLGAGTLVVSNPAAYDMLVNGFREHGIALDVQLMHSSEFLAGLGIDYASKAGELYYLDSDFLKNYNSDLPYPRRLLERLGAELLPFGTNSEESYSAGEGAIVLASLYPDLARKLARRVAEREPGAAKRKVVVASPCTRNLLAKETGLNVVTLEELACSCL